MLGPFWAIFAQMWATINFPAKTALSVFKYSDYLPSCQKLEKNYLAIPEKNSELTDDRQTEIDQR